MSRRARPAGRSVERDLQAERRATRDGDLRWAMEDPRGRRLLRELLYDPELGFGLDTQPFTGNGSVQFGEAAKRARAKEVDDRIQRDLPELWIAMHQEHLDTRAEEKHLRDTAAATPSDEDDPA